MNILIVGNSQAGALKRSHDARAAEIRSAGLNLNFLVIPGGYGPDLSIVEDRMVVGAVAPGHPPYMSPPDTGEMPLCGFDAVLVSALGYVDGGFAYKNPITTCGVLAEFSPHGVALNHAPVSDLCFRDMMRMYLERQAGIRSLRSICQAFDGPVFVQPFPRMSEQIKEHSDWGLRQWYRNPRGMHVFLEAEKDAALAQIATETGARIFGYPTADNPDLMSPRDLMREADCVHQADAYGSLVLDQLVGETRTLSLIAAS